MTHTIALNDRGPFTLFPAHREELSLMLSAHPGLVLIVGKCAESRVAFLEWLVRTMSIDTHMRVSVVALPGTFDIPSRHLVPVPTRGDRLVAGMKFALDTETDQIVLDVAQGSHDPELSRLARDASRWGIGIWAGVAGSDTAEAMTRFAEAATGPSRFLRGVIRLTTVPRLCPACASREHAVNMTLALERLMGSAAAGALSRGSGCPDCSQGVVREETLVEMSRAPRVPDPAQDNLDWDSLHLLWLRQGGMTQLRHALWHVGLGHCDLGDVLRRLGPLNADRDMIQAYSRQVVADLASTKDEFP